MRLAGKGARDMPELQLDVEESDGHKSTPASGESSAQISWIWYKSPQLGDGLDVTHGKLPSQ